MLVLPFVGVFVFPVAPASQVPRSFREEWPPPGGGLYDRVLLADEVVCRSPVDRFDALTSAWKIA